MVIIFPYLFSSRTYIYSYDQPVAIVKAKVSKALSGSGTFFIEKDYFGQVDGSNFTLSVESPEMVYGIEFGSTLVAKIIEVSPDQTKVKIRFRSSTAFKIISVISALAGIVYVYQSVTQSSMEYFLWGVAMIVAGPVICNWFAGISGAALESRYIRFIHKHLQSNGCV